MADLGVGSISWHLLLRRTAQPFYAALASANRRAIVMSAWDDSWRDTYDAWKTRTPEDDAPVCEMCGGWLYHDANFALYCGWCDDREAELQAMEDGEPATLEDLEELWSAKP